MSRSKELTKNYENIHDSVKANLNTIRMLVKQADELSNIIDKTNDDSLKRNLEDSVNKLHDIINTSVEESDKLFNQYLDFINSIAD